MSVNYIPARGRGYYRCIGRYNGGIETRCSMSRTVRAEEAEKQVWEFVYGILTEPACLTRGLDKMLENERQLPTKADEASWLGKISSIDRKQERLLNLHLEGDITTAQFRAKSAELKEARTAAESQLETARCHLSRLRDIERSKDTLISHYASLVPHGLAELSSDERNRIYKMMRLKVLADPDGTLTAEWGCNALSTLPGSCHTRGR